MLSVPTFRSLYPITGKPIVNEATRVYITPSYAVKTCDLSWGMTDIVYGLNLSHPNIISVLNYTISTNKRGVNLEFAMRAGERLPRLINSLDDLKVLAADIIAAISYLRDNWLVHGDIKPANIVRLNDTNYRYALIDLGLCRQIINGVNGTSIQGNAYTVAFRDYRCCHYNISAEAELYALGKTLQCLALGREHIDETDFDSTEFIKQARTIWYSATDKAKVKDLALLLEGLLTERRWSFSRCLQSKFIRDVSPLMEVSKPFWTSDITVSSSAEPIMPLIERLCLTAVKLNASLQVFSLAVHNLLRCGRLLNATDKYIVTDMQLYLAHQALKFNNDEFDHSLGDADRVAVVFSRVMTQLKDRVIVYTFWHDCTTVKEYSDRFKHLCTTLTLTAYSGPGSLIGTVELLKLPETKMLLHQWLLSPHAIEPSPLSLDQELERSYLTEDVGVIYRYLDQLQLDQVKGNQCAMTILGLPEAEKKRYYAVLKEAWFNKLQRLSKPRRRELAAVMNLLTY